MFGYDYEIIYKNKNENGVVNDISRKYEEEGFLFYLSFIIVEWLQSVHQEWLQDPKLSSLIQKLQHDTQYFPGYSWKNEDPRYKCHIYFNKKLNLKSTVLSKFHASPIKIQGLPKPMNG
jgi:hypothetical protein